MITNVNMRYRFFILLFLIVGIAFADAQNVIRPKIACPNDVWVNSYNGVLFYQRTDISITNRKMPLEATFYYNSSSNRTNYGYGNGWSLGYECRYHTDSLGIVVEQGDGRQDLYLRRGNAFEAPAGVFSTLTVIPSGGYTLTTKEGIIYSFSDTVSKCVTQIADRNGNSLRFAYVNNHLASISDGNGRSITLRWTDSLLTRIGTNFDDRTYLYAYDTAGNLTSVTDPMNHTVYYGYNRDNRISRFTDEAGYSTLVTYNGDGMAHRIKTDLTDKSIRYEQASRQTIIIDYLTDGNNQFTTYRWDTLGRVVEKTGNCCGYTSRLEYDGDNNVVHSEDANGNITTATYDGNGNMLSLTDPLGYAEHYTYTTDNNIATFLDKMGNRYSFTYDNHGNLTAINGPMGDILRVTYNEYGQAVAVADAMNNTTTYGYDIYGNRNRITDAMGNTTTNTFSIAGLIQSTTSPIGETTHYTYNRLEQLIKETDPLNNITQYQYDSRGNITKVIDALNNPITLTYDALSQPLTVSDAMGKTLHYTYNARQKLTQVIDAMGRKSRYRYDDRDRLTMYIDPNNDTTSYSYDGVGHILARFLPNGRIVEYDYDANNRLIKSYDQYGIIEQNIYNPLDNIIATISGNGDTTHYMYNTMRLVSSIRDALGHTQQFTYDANGNTLTFTDATNRTTTYTYNSLDQVLTETDEMNNTTTFAYNQDVQLSSVTDANGNTTSYQYDGNGNPTSIIYANGKSSSTTYDGVGNIISEQDESGHIATMQYDANGRMIKRTFHDGSEQQFTYNAMGDMTSATNANATTSFTYSPSGLLTSETLNGKTTRYEYNVRQGNITITYPSGRTIIEHYDLRNRLQWVSEGDDTIAKFSYDADNYIATRTYDNGLSSSYTFDAAKRLIRLTDGPSIIDHSMQYDADDNMIAKIDNLNTTQSEIYSYNAAHKLIDFKKGLAQDNQLPNPTRNIQYVLDALGNRTSITDNGRTTQYTHNATNAYTTVGNRNYQYDDRGNMIADGQHTYQYDGENNIVSVDNGATAIYQYDALGRRISKTVSGATTKFYYSGHKLLEEYDNEDNLIASYVVGRGVDNVLQMTKGTNKYYYHKDHLGSILAITDANGTVVERYEYDPYGNVTIFDARGSILQNSTIGNRYMFSGREYDNETGLYYFRARTMCPTLGRFMQADPYLYIDSYNYYTYVDNMPLRYIDANGFKRNPILDFLIGSCMDLGNWKCSSNLENGLNAIFCALDLGDLILDGLTLGNNILLTPGKKMLKKGLKKMLKEWTEKGTKNKAKKGVKKTKNTPPPCGGRGTEIAVKCYTGGESNLNRNPNKKTDWTRKDGERRHGNNGNSIFNHGKKPTPLREDQGKKLDIEI